MSMGMRLRLQMRMIRSMEYACAEFITLYTTEK